MIRIAGVGAVAQLMLATTVGADPLQAQLLARMRATDTADVGFTDWTKASQTGEAPREFVTRYDPRQPAAQRWTVVSVAGKPPTDKQRGSILKMAQSNKLPSYARLAEWFGAPATRVAQAGGKVTYRFASLPKGVVKMGSHDASADTAAEAEVNTARAVPYVDRIRFTSTTGFRMMLVAKIDRYSISADYAPLPDGRIFPTGQSAQFSGSVMGKSGSITTQTRYSVTR